MPNTFRIRILAGCFLFAIIAVARADEADVGAADRAEIQHVIGNQLDAFQHDDGARAFGFASPNIQSMFGNATRFMAMVRQGYPPVYRPQSVRFDDLVTMDGRLVQRVTLIGPDGRPVVALYTMEHESDGSWRIDGCALTKSDDVGA